MTRPYLTLEEWLSTDTELKKKFLDQETKLRPNQIQKITTSGSKDSYLSINHSQTKSNDNQNPSSLPNQSNSASIDQLFPNTAKFETEHFSLETSPEHFEILKKRFRSFKYNYTNKEANRISKQITLDQKTLKELERITDKYKLKSLQNCLDFLIDAHNFKLTEKDKIISRLKKEQNSNHDSNLRQELKLKDEKIIELEKELVRQKNTIHENMSKSTKEFEEYLIQIAVNKTLELDKIKAFLGDITEEDQRTINETLGPEVLSQIETQLRNECAEQKQLLINKNQSNTNKALGFDQHSQYGNTVQNDDEVEGISNNERSNVKN